MLFFELTVWITDIARMNSFASSLFPRCKALTQFVRHNNAKHWNPKWKKLRGEKVIKIDLSNFEKNYDQLTPDEKRTKMKEKGILPQKPWMERPIYISCTAGIFEPYVPPEGDGKFSAVTTEGAKQNIEFLTKKTKSYAAVKKIKRYEEGFNVKEFPDQVIDTYKDAHRALMDEDRTKLTQFVTEKLYPEMLYNIENKIIKWEFVKSLEPARVVHARSTNLITETNLFAQVTVRFHTQQKLSIYDRFGRLMSGSDVIPKDVLEYIVFEKHISNEYGKWRLHAKIIPPWMPIQKTLVNTVVLNQ